MTSQFIFSICASIIIVIATAAALHYRLRTRVERRDSHRRLADLEREAIGSMQRMRGSALAQISAGLAHEINNPLAILSGLSSKLSRLAELGPVAGAEAEDIARRLAETSERISRTMRAFRAITKNAAHENIELVSATDAMDDALLVCRERFHNHAIRVDVARPPERAWLEGRASELSQLFLQLLEVTFDNVQVPGSVGDWWVKVAIAEVEDTVEIRFSDNGPRHRDGNATPFSELGLRLCRNAIESLYGRLELNASEAHQQYVVVLPKRQPRALAQNHN